MFRQWNSNCIQLLHTQNNPKLAFNHVQTTDFCYYPFSKVTVWGVPRCLKWFWDVMAWNARKKTMKPPDVSWLSPGFPHGIPVPAQRSQAQVKSLVLRSAFFRCSALYINMSCGSPRLGKWMVEERYVRARVQLKVCRYIHIYICIYMYICICI